jgi:hypothetical protein
MPSPAEEETIIGTFADAHVADLAADSARKAGFHVSRRFSAWPNEAQSAAKQEAQRQNLTWTRAQRHHAGHLYQLGASSHPRGRQPPG